MPNPHSLQFPRLAMGSLLLAALISPLPAQEEKPKAVEGEVFTLSPFEVDGSGDVGYQATSTVSGSRLNTRLKDVGASVSILTQEMLEDLGATDVESSLPYVAGFETNETVDTATTTAYVEDSQHANPSMTRVRGLSPADVTTDFFLATHKSFDTYNVERVSVVRGPNSILFGLGSPSGIINYSTRKAETEKDFGTVEFRADQFGTLRGSVDINQVLLKNRVAFRFMGLDEREKFQFDDTFSNDRRGTLTLTIRPTTTTTVRASYERIDISARRPGYNPPTDNITGWIEAGRPTHDPAASPGRVPPPGLGGLVGGENYPAMFFGDATSPTPDLWSLLENFRTRGARLPVNQRTTFLRSYNPEAATPYYVDPQVNNTTLFPIFDYDLTAAPGSWQKWNGDRKWLVLNQRFGKKLNVELSYYDDETIADRHTQIIGQQNSIQIDVNETLPNGDTNPNFLRPFVFGRGVGRYTEDKTETLRAQFAYEFSLEDLPGGSILGHHRLAGLYSTNSMETWTYAWEHRIGQINEANTSTLDSASRRTQAIWYVGPAFTADMDAPVINQMPAYAPPVGVPIPYNYYNDATKTWETADGMSLERLVHRNALWDLQDSTAYGLTLQSFWWQDRIVTILGWRNDEVTGNSTTYPDPGPDGLYSLDRDDWTFEDPPLSADKDTYTKGIVFHATDWLSFHYNESENFVVSAPKVNILGETIPGSSGTGKDYGLTLTLLQEKLYAKLNFYETVQENASNAATEFAAFWRITAFEQGIYDRIENNTITGVDWINWDGTTERYERFANVSDVNDYTAEGMEFELTYNPTRNWRILFNASRQETVQNNTGLALVRYLEQRAPFYDQLWDQQWNVNQTVRQYYNANVAERLEPALAADGRASLGQAEWSWNAVTSYQFSKGRLRGVGFGAALRWSDKRALGYGLKMDDTGNLVTDLDRPFYGPSNFNLGVHAYIRRKIFNGKVNWKLQLNIRNLIGDDDLVPSRINPDGQVGAWKIGREPIYLLTSTFKY